MSDDRKKASIDQAVTESTTRPLRNLWEGVDPAEVAELMRKYGGGYNGSCVPFEEEIMLFYPIDRSVYYQRAKKRD